MIDAPQDPRTREFLARTHGTGAHVHGGVAMAAAPVAEVEAPVSAVASAADVAGLDHRPGVDMPHGH